MSDTLRERVVAAIGHQYELEDEIGRGGMSVVYRARDRRLDRTVALKVLPPDLAHDPAVRTRFAREAHTAAQLAHPHIVPIHDVGEQDGIAWLVMSHVDGGNLAARLAQQPRPPVTEVRRLLAEIADGLAFAHARGVIHRDIKPDNILLDRESGRAMVTDFGIARAIEAGARLTNTGIAVGTPAYMSPEQAIGDRALDGRSDIYALGVLGYQMLTGRVPFSAGNALALLMKHVNEPPRPILEVRPDVPRPLREAVERALAKAPEDRWPTAASLRDALTSGAAPAGAWRSDAAAPVRYVSPREGSLRTVAPRREAPSVSDRPEPHLEGATVVEPPHLASLTRQQRDDLRLWHGRVPLVERVKAVRGYALFTIAMWGLGIAGFAGGVTDVPPLVLAPLVPAFMTRKLWQRAQSLRRSGLALRRVFFMPLARWVLPAAPPLPTEHQLLKLAPREILEGPSGAAVRRAVEDRAAILGSVARLPKPDRALVPDLEPTVTALVARVVDLARALARLDGDIDPRLAEQLDARIGQAETEPASPEGERRLALLRRQRDTVRDLAERRAVLARQLESAGLALGSLRLDLVKLGSQGIQAAITEVSTATQEARALSREIDAVLSAAEEVSGL